MSAFVKAYNNVDFLDDEKVLVKFVVHYKLQMM